MRNAHPLPSRLIGAAGAVALVVALAGACSGKITTQNASLPPGCTQCSDASPDCVDVRIDVQNCGACGNRCAAGQVCTAGACAAACGAGFSTCGARCADLQSDTASCGACGAACTPANASPACVRGQCGYGACAAGFGDCDGNAKNGCEQNTGTDLQNCGGCGVACSPVNAQSPACTGGKCGYGACAAGFFDCDGNKANGCEANGSIDPANCGKCANACTGGQICSRGVCGSPPPLLAQTSFAYPTSDNGGVTAPRAFVLSIQTIGPGLIFYTADGSTPTTSSPHAPSPITLSVTTNTIVRWFTSLDPTINTHNAAIDTSRQGSIGEFMDSVAFDVSGGPVVVATPGQGLDATVHFQAWNGAGYCPGCVRVYGIGVTAVEQCFAATVPPAWPGLDMPGARIHVTAPIQRGVYRLQRGVNLDFVCRPGSGAGGDDGTIIVQ